MTDTSPEAEEVRIRALRKMSPARRLQMALGWSNALRDLIKANLRRQFHDATDATLSRMLADRWLGPELAAKAYGPLHADR